MVLESAAGFYVGRLAYDAKGEVEGPYDRLSFYYPSREDAQDALDSNDYAI